MWEMLISLVPTLLSTVSKILSNDEVYEALIGNSALSNEEKAAITLLRRQKKEEWDSLEPK